MRRNDLQNWAKQIEQDNNKLTTKQQVILAKAVEIRYQADVNQRIFEEE